MKIIFQIIIIHLIFLSEFLYGNQKELANSDTIGHSAYYIVTGIEISGNKVTKKQIVLRELTFGMNDTIISRDLQYHIERSTDNLLKTSLFNYVYFDTITEGKNLLKIFIQLEERWYTWPEIHFNHADRNISAWWQSKDFSRINYGLGLSQYNFRGRKEKISIRGVTGFTRQFALTYDGIHLDRKQEHSLNLAAFYDNQNQAVYITRENVPRVFSDNHIIYRKQNYIVKYTYRHRLYNIHRFIISYVKYNISDTIIHLNPAFLGAGKRQSDFLTFIYYFESDHTDLKYYPLNGSIFNCQLTYSGLLQSGFDKLELRTGFYKFYKFFPGFYGSAGLKIQLAHKSRIPYIITMGLGYDDFLRGYENYVIDGNNFLLFKSSVKYELLPFRIIKLNFLPVRQFNKIHISSYLNLFFDAGYVHDYYPGDKVFGNSLVDKPLYSGGIGIDMVTYYDKMLRIDLALNSMGDLGLFVSLEQKF
jgi:outer membrane protein assembly factor BamA